MISTRAELITYPAPPEAIVNNDFSVRVRLENGEWQEQFPYLVPVDMLNVREASMVTYDFEGVVEVEVTKRDGIFENVDLRPNSYNIPFHQIGNTVTFKVDRPRKLSFEANGERFHNLHLFANPPETNVLDLEDPRTICVKPGNHRTEDLIARLTSSSNGKEALSEVLYFGPGMHYIEEIIFGQGSISRRRCYGSGLNGMRSCRRCHDQRTWNYLFNEYREDNLFALRTNRFLSQHYGGGHHFSGSPSLQHSSWKSEHIHISNFKTFSTRGWSDGIDMMSCSYVDIDDVFLRTSDDCIAIYGSRGKFYGESTNISVTNSVLWADVAHPIMIGVHGDHEHNGDIIENIVFDNIDILEHHEPQDDWGCMAINAADKNIVRNVTYRNFRVKQFELGRLIDIRVFQNPKYNPSPGNRVENIRFENIEFNGVCDNPSFIEGFDGERIVEGGHD
ncbi:glycosyl hydrolase family 28 protein [Paenibacillus alkaliterrae]|uniref:glycosyl hydrolase family 28 protein n=1 Tax=Paenibacillus alkaliterrae TaxID=320909 RepID=UPI001F412B01|nr:glycosyl hydrolase family 28 protein [Paenibacillus alkaliterrae]MCF2941789.1 glycosyl hydrolase family 28 protein [Paenibacillus alkaliterrae]